MGRSKRRGSDGDEVPLLIWPEEDPPTHEDQVRLLLLLLPTRTDEHAPERCCCDRQAYDPPVTNSTLLTRYLGRQNDGHTVHHDAEAWTEDDPRRLPEDPEEPGVVNVFTSFFPLEVGGVRSRRA